MGPIRCEACGRPATIHETAIRGGEAASRHFCREHGEPTVAAVDLGPAASAEAFRAAGEYYQGLADAEREHLALLYRLGRRGG